jgi:hypothetical protein
MTATRHSLPIRAGIAVAVLSTVTIVFTIPKESVLSVDPLPGLTVLTSLPGQGTVAIPCSRLGSRQGPRGQESVMYRLEDRSGLGAFAGIEGSPITTPIGEIVGVVHGQFGNGKSPTFGVLSPNAINSGAIEWRVSDRTAPGRPCASGDAVALVRWWGSRLQDKDLRCTVTAVNETRVVSFVDYGATETSTMRRCYGIVRELPVAIGHAERSNRVGRQVGPPFAFSSRRRGGVVDGSIGTPASIALGVTLSFGNELTRTEHCRIVTQGTDSEIVAARIATFVSLALLQMNVRCPGQCSVVLKSGASVIERAMRADDGQWLTRVIHDAVREMAASVTHDDLNIRIAIVP